MIDIDQHRFEPRTMWRDHIDPGMRDKALAIDDDGVGHAWLTWQGRQLYVAESQRPRDTASIAEGRRRLEAGLPPVTPFDEDVPPSYSDPAARLDLLDAFGVDEAALFPNFGLLWEEMLGDDVAALCANLRACNRWQAEAVTDGRGRLHPVAHLTLRDQDWAVEEIARIANDGIRLAMVGPAPVDGKPLSHRSLDRVWAAFCEHGVSPVFHVGGFKDPLDPAWHDGDPEPGDQLLTSVFLWVAPAVALANMIVHGTLERFPELRIGVVELSAGWVPMFLLNLDGACDFYAARHGRLLVDLPLRPSEYFRRQVRVSAMPYELPARLVRLVGEDTFMVGSDWPHAEGVSEPGAEVTASAAGLDDTARDKLLDGNARWLLHA